MLPVYFLQQWFNVSDPQSEDAIYDSESMRRFAGVELCEDVVDAAIIAAPSSTKNATGARNPEMKQTRKGKNWQFGMKLQIGTDRRGVVHSVTQPLQGHLC